MRHEIVRRHGTGYLVGETRQAVRENRVVVMMCVTKKRKGNNIES